MKAIVNGRRYDTDAARTVEVACNSSGRGNSTRDWHYVCETLYRSGGGHWFIHGEGGGLTQYAGERGDMRAPGEGIVPLSPDQAREWLELFQETEALEQWFGEDIEDADAPPPRAAELRALRERAGMTQAQFAAQLGVAPNTVARLERGERRPSEPILRLARIVAERAAP